MPEPKSEEFLRLLEERDRLREAIKTHEYAVVVSRNSPWPDDDYDTELWEVLPDEHRAEVRRSR